MYFRSPAMTALLDVDQLRTFIAIVETGSFTRAAETVPKTQSAVSMQMKRLGVRLGVPDDYADRYLPEIMARFSRAYTGAELTVICEPTVDLIERIDANDLDLAIITHVQGQRPAETFRGERLLWVTSSRHPTHQQERVPLALGRPTCNWRRVAIDRLETVGRPYRVLYSSSNAGAVAAAVLAGLAVSVLPESGLRPGMRVLSPADGFPELPSCRIGLVRNPQESSALSQALADHIISSLDNLSQAREAAE